MAGIVTLCVSIAYSVSTCQMRSGFLIVQTVKAHLAGMPTGIIACNQPVSGTLMRHNSAKVRQYSASWGY